MKWWGRNCQEIIFDILFVFFIGGQGTSCQLESKDKIWKNLKWNNTISVKHNLKYEIISPACFLRTKHKSRYTNIPMHRLTLWDYGKSHKIIHRYISKQASDFNMIWLGYICSRVSIYQIWIVFSIVVLKSATCKVCYKLCFFLRLNIHLNAS